MRSCLWCLVLPNPSLKLTRYGRRCKPGLSQQYHRLSPGLQHLPPRSGLPRTLGRTNVHRAWAASTMHHDSDDEEPPSADMERLNEEQWQRVAEAVARALSTVQVPESVCSIPGNRFDRYALDLVVYDCRALTFDGGWKLAAEIRRELRKLPSLTWTVRLHIQPLLQVPAADFVVWLEVTQFEITQSLGARKSVMFESLPGFKAACWG